MSDTYPATPGYVRGSDTSEAAAASLDEGRLSYLRRIVLEHVTAADGATCDEVETALDMLHQTASARLRELYLGGFVSTTGERRATRTGRMAYVYRRVPANV